MKVPIVVFFYRRPHLLDGLFSSIKKYRPNCLWLVADGPKNKSLEETNPCLEARQKIENIIDWPCQIHRLYADVNLGLPKRFESGLDALFQVEEQAIILEEDCHPAPDFFPFCEAMLTKYSHHPLIGGVSGNCFLKKETDISSDYYFSKYLHTWGWATWSRAWKNYDRDQWTWPKNGLRGYFPGATAMECSYWNDIYKGVLSGSNDHWDYRWLADLWKRKMLAVVPSQNLVRNMGFGPGATHTRDDSVDVGVERENPLLKPYEGPEKIEANTDLDLMTLHNHFLRTKGKRNLWQKLRDRLQRIFRPVHLPV